MENYIWYFQLKCQFPLEFYLNNNDMSIIVLYTYIVISNLMSRLVREGCIMFVALLIPLLFGQ